MATNVDARQPKAKLAAFVPCSRFDYFESSNDYLRGWTFSRFGVERNYQNNNSAFVKCGVGIYVENVDEGTYVRESWLYAVQHDAVLGRTSLKWKEPNTGNSFRGTVSIFEWVQDLSFDFKEEALIQISVEVAISCWPEPLKVEGSGFIFAATSPSTRGVAFKNPGIRL